MKFKLITFKTEEDLLDATTNLPSGVYIDMTIETQSIPNSIIMTEFQTQEFFDELSADYDFTLEDFKG